MASDEAKRADMERRAAERAAREHAAKALSEIRQWLGRGGQDRIRLQARGDIYSRLPGGKRERDTVPGESARVSTLLSPKLKLTAHQRAVGQCFGAYAEAVTTGGGSAFLREHVDGGGANGGGATERMIQMVRMVDTGQRAARGLGFFAYPVGAARGEKRVGAHRPVKALDLLQAVCVFGWTLSAVAVESQWLVERDGRMVVADRQRKALAAHLATVLDAVADAWEDRGYQVPSIFSAIIVE